MSDQKIELAVDEALGLLTLLNGIKDLPFNGIELEIVEGEGFSVRVLGLRE